MGGFWTTTEDSGQPESDDDSCLKQKCGCTFHVIRGSTNFALHQITYLAGVMGQHYDEHITSDVVTKTGCWILSLHQNVSSANLHQTVSSANLTWKSEFEAEQITYKSYLNCWLWHSLKSLGSCWKKLQKVAWTKLEGVPELSSGVHSCLGTLW